MGCKFKIAIVGRPNVGKSALFNRILGRRIAIVDEAEGITRDRLIWEGEIFGHRFDLIDTGGIDPKSKATFNEQIRQQALLAIDEADALIFVVDGVVGATKLDYELAKLLLKTKKPLVVAVNKIDDADKQKQLYPFYSLGIEHLVGVSALHGRNIADLFDPITPLFSKTQDESQKVTHLAIVGRPNVGKSTLVNTLLAEERCIASPLPGTTRDSIDIPFSYNENEYVLIDTAGIRRKKSEAEVVDKFAFLRTERAIERSDVVLFLIDVRDGLTTQEKKIANLIEKSGKGCVVLLNKWDLVPGFRTEHCIKAIADENPFLAHCPIIPISAKNGRHLHKLFPLIQRVFSALTRRIKTHELNTFIERALQVNPPPRLLGKRFRIYYMTQIEISPPSFVLFVNNPGLMIPSYKRYLINQFRKKFGFTGAPLRLFLKPKKAPTRTPQLHAESKEWLSQAE